MVRGQTAHLYGDDVAAIAVDHEAMTQEFPDSLCAEAEVLMADSAALAERWPTFDR